MAARTFDVVIAGGGLAGSSLGGVLARSGFGVLVVEKESGFRDRIRGELTWPWGHCEALRVGLGEALDQAGVVKLPVLDFYEDGRRVDGVGGGRSRSMRCQRSGSRTPICRRLSWLGPSHRAPQCCGRRRLSG